MTEKRTKEDWERLIDDYERKVLELEIPENPSESQVKHLASKIDDLYSRASFDHGKAMADHNKIDNLIDRVEVKNKIGTNEDERKRKAVEAVENYVTSDDRKINLYSSRNDAYRIKNRMDKVIKALKAKTQNLTISYGTLKMEIDLQKF